MDPDAPRADLLPSAPILDGVAPALVERWRRSLAPRTFAVGETIMSQGDLASFFLLIDEGTVGITRVLSGVTETVAVNGPGSIVGELALLRRGRRSATATALTEVKALLGDEASFAAMLDLPGRRGTVVKLVAGRLARLATPVPVVAADGGLVVVRPGLPTDRDHLVHGIESMSPESLRSRFFSSGTPPASVIDYLVNIDYVDHFAWIVLDGPGPDATAIGSGRYVRSQTIRNEAEVALGVVDAHQRRGLGAIIMSALAIAARAADIDTFTAVMLAENLAVRTLFARFGATFHFDEPGFVDARFEVNTMPLTVNAEVANQLEAAAELVVWGAGTVLH